MDGLYRTHPTLLGKGQPLRPRYSNTEQRNVPRRNVTSRCLAVIAGGSIVVGCGLRASPSLQQVHPTQTHAAKATRYTISADDLSEVAGSSLEDAVRRLRPEWLRLNPTARQPTLAEHA